MELSVLYSGYFVYAFIGGIILAMMGGYLGVFLVLKRYSLLADAISHIALLGAALTFLLQTQNIWINIFVVVASSLLIEFVRKNGRFQSDSVVAIFITGSLAIAITVFSITKKNISGIEGYLFGSLATVGQDDFIAICAVSIVSLFVFWFYFDKFKLLLFDEEFARVCGLKTEVLNYILIATMAAFIAVAIKTIGVLTVSAILVVPALTSLSFRLTFLPTVILSSVVAVIGAIFGTILSVSFALPIGTTIVLVLVCLFAIAVILAKKQ